jgi:hypothetical protein
VSPLSTGRCRVVPDRKTPIGRHEPLASAPWKEDVWRKLASERGFMLIEPGRGIIGTRCLSSRVLSGRQYAVVADDWSKHGCVLLTDKGERFLDGPTIVLLIRSPFRVTVNGLEGPGEGVGDEGDQLADCARKGTRRASAIAAARVDRTRDRDVFLAYQPATGRGDARVSGMSVGLPAMGNRFLIGFCLLSNPALRDSFPHTKETTLIMRRRDRNDRAIAVGRQAHAVTDRGESRVALAGPPVRPKTVPDGSARDISQTTTR